MVTPTVAESKAATVCTGQEDAQQEVCAVTTATSSSFQHLKVASVSCPQIGHNVVQHPPVDPSSTQTSSVFSWALSNLGSGLGWAAKSTVPHVVSWAIGGSTRRTTREVSTLAAEIDKATGSKHLSAALMRLSRRLGLPV